MTSFITDQERTQSPNQLLAIRAFDLIIATGGLLLLTPVLLLAGLLLKLSRPGPILLKRPRVGRDGQTFNLLHFKPAANCGRLWTLLNTGLQLVHVLNGDLSLIGPWPARPEQVAHYTPAQRRLLGVRPGLISPAAIYLWQQQAQLGLTMRDRDPGPAMEQRLSLDLAYIGQRTLWTDSMLLLKAGLLGLSRLLRFGRRSPVRNRHILLLDLLALLLVPAVALTLRLDTLHWAETWSRGLLVYTGLVTVIKLFIFYQAGLYRRYWHYASVSELLLVVYAVALTTLVAGLVMLGLHNALVDYQANVPRTLFLIDGLLTGLVVAGSRLSVRSLYQTYRHNRVVGGRRVLIVGAGEQGSLVVREMQTNPQLELEPVAFIDDDPAKLGTRIQGLPVLGRSEDLARVVEQQRVQQIIVAMPSAPLVRQRELLAMGQATGRATFTLPGMYELLAGFKSVHRLPQVDIQQLLQREPIEIDRSEVERSLRGALVLVTGAGGSIGSELCRQIARCEPREIILLGHGENSIFEIGLDLKLAFPRLVTRPVIADVREAARIEEVVGQYQPDIIFHAAAHKHVPFMQNNAAEALANNVLGTRHVLEAAAKHGVARFVLISSDKAVHPSSTMGATKRLAELLTIATAQRTGRAYMAVRFGNVLGSRGSVIPIFQRQIASGGPLTVTHPRMERYFMTIPEAVQLVLQASVLGRGAEVFVLDMGKPVKIVDLAREMLKLSGLEPGRDIDIVFSGIRPGEKMSEALFMAQERHRRTKHEKIFVAPPSAPVNGPALAQAVLDLIEQAQTFDRALSQAGLEPDGQEILRLICCTIEQYQPPAAPAPPTQPASSPASRPHDTHPLDGPYARSASAGV